MTSRGVRRLAATPVLMILATGLPGSGQETAIALSSPSVFVGSEADGGATFSRISDVVPLPDGRFAVGDDGNIELLILDPELGIVDVWGAHGQGPGEFESVRGLWIDGARLYVLDTRAGRITGFSADGLVEETIALELPPGRVGSPELALPAALGGKLFLGGLSASPPEGGFSADILTLMRYSDDGAFEAALGSEVTLSRFHIPGFSGAHAFSPRASIAGFGSDVYLGNGLVPSIRRFSVSGVERDPLILSGLPEPPGAREAWEKVDSLLDVAELPARVRGWLADQPRDPRPVPSYSAFVVDAVDGTLWVKEFNPNRDYAVPSVRNKPGGVWHQIEPSGATVARYAMPDPFVLLRVHDGRFIGYTIGAFDEHIVTIFERP